MSVLALNRRARHDYLITDKYKAGISLKGFEVKAIREGKVDFNDSYVKILDGKPVLINLYVGRYSRQGEDLPSDERRTRDLLLSKDEVDKLHLKSREKGFSLVPLQLISDHGLIKLEFALAKGKKKIDKKDDLKIKQIERDAKLEEKEFKKTLTE